MNKLHLLTLSTALLAVPYVAAEEISAPVNQQENVVEVRRIKVAEISTKIDASDADDLQKEAALEIISRKGSETLQELNEKCPAIRGVITLTGLELVDQAAQNVENNAQNNRADANNEVESAANMIKRD